MSPLGFSEDDLYMAIGGRVRAARERVGLTQEALGELVGLGRTSITNIERGRQRMTVHTLFGLAAAVGEVPAALLPNPLSDPVPALDSVIGLSDEERQWIRTIVSPAGASEE
jgi:transcriptional regulator with XRE-family HTH domain